MNWRRGWRDNALLPISDSEKEVTAENAERTVF